MAFNVFINTKNESGMIQLTGIYRGYFFMNRAALLLLNIVAIFDLFYFFLSVKEKNRITLVHHSFMRRCTCTSGLLLNIFGNNELNVTSINK